MYVRVKGEGPKARVYVMESVRRGSKVVGVVREKLGTSKVITCNSGAILI